MVVAAVVVVVVVYANIAVAIEIVENFQMVEVAVFSKHS